MKISMSVMAVLSLFLAMSPGAEAETPPSISRIVKKVAVEVPLAKPRSLSVTQTSGPATSRRGVGRRILGGAVGGVGGLFGGGYLGAAIEGDRCNCDDPGLVGALIGAPVGAVVGALLGQQWLF